MTVTGKFENTEQMDLVVRMSAKLSETALGPAHEDERCTCGCSPVFTINYECSWCRTRYCEERNKCVNWEQCHNAYCDECAPRWLPQEAASVCIFCVNARHQVQLGRFFAAASEGFGGTE